jgi:hypothetical protein
MCPVAMEKEKRIEGDCYQKGQRASTTLASYMMLICERQQQQQSSSRNSGSSQTARPGRRKRQDATTGRELGPYAKAGCWLGKVGWCVKYYVEVSVALFDTQQCEWRDDGDVRLAWPWHGLPRERPLRERAFPPLLSHHTTLRSSEANVTIFEANRLQTVSSISRD